jgi:NADH-quinone oxidoreductase subunit I
MEKIINLIKYVTFWEILKGMSITLRNLFTKPITVDYPAKPRPAFQTYRGIHALQRYEDGREVCIGCSLCEAYCPARAIEIHTHQDPNNKNEKIVDVYNIDLLRCIYCGLCVEVCPVEAIVQTREYELAGRSREEFIFTKDKLLEMGRKYSGKEVYRAYNVNN